MDDNDRRSVAAPTNDQSGLDGAGSSQESGNELPPSSQEILPPSSQDVEMNLFSDTQPPIQNIPSDTSDDDMPQLQDVSDSSDDEFSDSDDGNLDDEMNAPVPSSANMTAEQDAQSFLAALSAGLPQRNNRRARVEDDDDEDRDRRHPSQRVGTPSNVNPIPPPTAPHSRIFAPGSLEGMIPARTAAQPQQAPPHPFRHFQHFLPRTNVPTAGNNANNNPAQPPPAPNNQPVPHVVRHPGGISISFDMGAMPMLANLGGPDGGAAAPRAPGGGNANHPGAAPRQGFGGDFNIFTELLSRFGGVLTRPEPKEDPERAKKLVSGLDVVPVGLVRRLERVGDVGGEDTGGSGGDSCCAICWDRLLDGDGQQFGNEKETASGAPQVEGDTVSSVIEASTSFVVPSDTDKTLVESAHPKIVSLPCAHVFHASCLIPWFSRPRQTTCPTCRFNIDPENLTYNPPRPTPRAVPAVPPLGTAAPAAATANAPPLQIITADGQVFNPNAAPAPANGNAQPQPIRSPADILSLIGDRMREQLQGGLPPPVMAEAGTQTNIPATSAAAAAPAEPIPDPDATLEFDALLDLIDPEGALDDDDPLEGLGNDDIPLDDNAISQITAAAQQALGQLFGIPAPAPADERLDNDDDGDDGDMPGLEPVDVGAATRDEDPVDDDMPGLEPVNAPAESAGTGPAATAPVALPLRTPGQNPPPNADSNAHTIPRHGTLTFGINMIIGPDGPIHTAAADMTGDPFAMDNETLRQRFRDWLPPFNVGPPPAAVAQQAQVPANASNVDVPVTAPQATPVPAANAPINALPFPFPGVNLQRPMMRPFTGPGGLGGFFGAFTTGPRPLQQARAPAQAPPGQAPAPAVQTPGPAAPIPSGRPMFGPGRMPLEEFTQVLLPGVVPVPRTGPRKTWSVPTPPGLTLRQRIEKKEREAGLRCFDVSCGVGPSDDEPFVELSEEGRKQVAILALGDEHDGEKNLVCEHTFHAPCLVTAQRVALRGAAPKEVSEQVEVECSVCRAEGGVKKTQWEAGVTALA